MANAHKLFHAPAGRDLSPSQALEFVAKRIDKKKNHALFVLMRGVSKNLRWLERQGNTISWEEALDFEGLIEQFTMYCYQYEGHATSRGPDQPGID